METSECFYKNIIILNLLMWIFFTVVDVIIN